MRDNKKILVKRNNIQEIPASRTNAPTYINYKTSYIPKLIKPFTVMADDANKKGEHSKCEYFDNLTNMANCANRNIYKLNYMYQIQISLLDVFKAVMDLILFEFDWADSELQQHIKYACSLALDSAYSNFPTISFIADIYNYAKTCVNENDTEGFINKVRELSVNPADFYATSVASIFAKALFDAFAKEMITNNDSETFEAITTSLSPIIYDFKNELMDAAITVILMPYCRVIPTDNN